jgi:Protein of unknown function (DUF3800)
MMLVCYLDDSGKDSQNPITTIAGYLASEEAWAEFEKEVEPYFAERNVKVLHAVDLHNTRGEFKGSSVLNKEAFVARIAQVASKHVAFGVSMSAEKGNYRDHAIYRSDTSRQTVAPYTFCFQVILDWLLRDIRIGKRVHSEGIKFLLEEGHDNNAQAKKEFHWTREHYKLESVLHSIDFVKKDSCRAIQLADLIAFYSRRDGVTLLKSKQPGAPEYKMDQMIKILCEKVVHRGFVATGFSDRE